MNKHKITDKNMSNKHYRRTENDIFAAYFSSNHPRTASIIAKHAGISRSTLFRHHGNIQNIPTNYEDYLFRKYDHRIATLCQKQTPSLKVIYFHTLAFITNHKDIYKGLFLDNHKVIIKKMLDRIKPIIISNPYYSGSIEKVYNIYENEILGVIEAWSYYDFSVTRLNRALNDILYLTETAPKHLAPLLQ